MENTKDYLEELKKNLVKNGGRLKTWMHDISIDIACDYDITSSECLSDMFSEYADGRVDVYNSDLLEWAKYNYEYVEEAIDEFGVAKDCDGKADFMRTIMSGQFMYYERQLYDDEKEIYKLMAINYMLRNCEFYTKEQIDEILERIEDEVESWDRADVIMDIIKEVVNGGEDNV